ncbi:MAG: exonuclease subunit SbcD [Elainellaceae cyanobacterium]
MIKLLHLSDIHLGSGFAHGYTNPETGLNTRFEDFVSSLRQCIDRAIADDVDLVLFGGDAFPDATPPPLVQEAFAREFRRLVDVGIPTVMLVGNHDQYAQGQGGASLCIYRTLGVPSVIVGDRLTTHRIDTASGPVQVLTLPWLNRSTLLTRPETEGLSMVEINELLLSRLRVALEGEIRKLDPHCPTVLLAHLMADTASFGAERFLAVGKGFTVPMALLCRPCFDYVALGHVHRHQILNDQPPIVYPGSIERVDFSEESEEKGFVRVNLEQGHAEVEFCPLEVRPFRTLRVNVTEVEDAQQVLLEKVRSSDIEDAVVRLIYQIRPHQLDALNMAELQEALAIAHTATIHPELVSQLARPRLPELGLGQGLEPLDALKTYLEHRSDLTDLSTDLLTAAQALMADDAVDLAFNSATHESKEGDPQPASLYADEATPERRSACESTAQQLRLI